MADWETGQKAAEVELNRVFFGTMGRMSVAGTLSCVDALGFDEVVNRYRDSTERFVERTLKDPKMVAAGVPLAVNYHGGVDAFVVKFVDRFKEHCQIQIAAASIALVHSVADASVLGYCRAAARADGEAFAAALPEKRKLFESDPVAYFADVGDRISLPGKVKFLRQICVPESATPAFQAAMRDEDVLAADALRHRIVHEDAMFGPIPDYQKHVQVLQQMTYICAFMVALHFKLKLYENNQQLHENGVVMC